MKKEAQDFYDNTRKYFIGAVIAIEKLEKELETMEDMCDTVLVLKKTDEYIDKLRKEADKLSQHLQTVVAMTLMGRGKKSYKTKYVTATRASKTNNNLPSYNTKPEEYRALCQALGVPKAMADRGVFSFHWPRLGDYVTELAKEGKPKPEGLGDPQPTLYLRLLQKQDISANEDSEETPF